MGDLRPWGLDSLRRMHEMRGMHGEARDHERIQMISFLFLYILFCARGLVAFTLGRAPWGVLALAMGSGAGRGWPGAGGAPGAVEDSPLSVLSHASDLSMPKETVPGGAVPLQ